MLKLLSAAVVLGGGAIALLAGLPGPPDAAAMRPPARDRELPPARRLVPSTPAFVEDDPLPRHIAARQAAVARQVELQRLLDTEVAALRSVVDVNAYLDKLEARARAAGRVTFLELEPGREALLALPLEYEEAQRQVQLFTDRMATLSAALHPGTQSGERQ